MRKISRPSSNRLRSSRYFRGSQTHWMEVQVTHSYSMDHRTTTLTSTYLDLITMYQHHKIFSSQTICRTAHRFLLPQVRVVQMIRSWMKQSVRKRVLTVPPNLEQILIKSKTLMTSFSIITITCQINNKIMKQMELMKQIFSILMYHKTKIQI